MASYSYVNWQPDDEVTSSKLKQMSDNSQHIFDQMITGDIKVSTGFNGLLPSGRAVGTKVAKKIEGLHVPFDSLVPTARHTVEIPYNNIWTSPPIVVFTVKSFSNRDILGQIFFDQSLSKCTIQVFRRDLAAVQLVGSINAVAIGV